MKYVITAVAVAVALFVTNGTASAQHRGGHSGSRYSPPAQYDHGSSYGGYLPGPSVRTYSSPLYNPGVGAYSTPGYYVPNASIYDRPNFGSGHSMPRNTHSDRAHHRR